MNNKEFDRYYKIYYIDKKLIQRIARKLSFGDEELYNDLAQEGLWRLKNLEPEKAVRNKDAWIRQAIKFALIDYLRRNELHKYESLDRRLLAGEQIEKDPVTGDLRLISYNKDVRIDREFKEHGHSKRSVVEEDNYE